MPRIFAKLLSFGLVALATLGVNSAAAQNVIERSAEYRYQLDFHVPDAALAKFLPAGWDANISQQGNAKDANLRLIFINWERKIRPRCSGFAQQTGNLARVF